MFLPQDKNLSPIALDCFHFVRVKVRLISESHIHKYEGICGQAAWSAYSGLYPLLVKNPPNEKLIDKGKKKLNGNEKVAPRF